MTTSEREHVLFVHAHPDDETITTGGTIATLLDAGASVTLVTCTRGELGEVVPAELQHLAGEALGAHREGELAAAMAILGLDDHRFLGDNGARAPGAAPHRYLDSGMQWGPNGPEPLPVASDFTVPDAASAGLNSTLTAASLDTLVSDLCAVIEHVRPTAIVSYDSGGGYGHPDHVRTHELAGVAAVIMDVPFYTIVPPAQAAEGDIRVEVSHVLERKKRALQAHRTQLTVVGDSIVHSGGQREPITRIEVFRRDGDAQENGLECASVRVSSKILTWAFAFLGGATVGAIGTVQHQLAWGAFSLLLAAVALVGLRLLFGTRTVAGFAALGAVAMATLLGTESLGGSVLVPVGTAGMVWTFGLPLVILVVLAWPGAVRGARDTMGPVIDPEKVVDAS